MDSVINAYFWSGVIGNLLIILLFLSLCLFVVIFCAIATIPVSSENGSDSTTAKRVAFIASFLLALTLATITFLPSEETRQTFIAAKIAAVQNDDSLLPSERDALQKLAATLPQTTKQKYRGGQ